MKVMASGTTGRLYKELVVTQKKASDAGGWFSGSGMDSGRIGLYAIAADGVALDAVEQAIDAVIAEVLDKGVTQKELDRARNSYIASYVYGSDSQSRLARRYGWGLANGRTVADIEAWPERLGKVTTDDVARVARKYLDKTHSVTGLLLPKKNEQGKAGDAPGQNKS